MRQRQHPHRAWEASRVAFSKVLTQTRLEQTHLRWPLETCREQQHHPPARLYFPARPRKFLSRRTVQSARQHMLMANIYNRDVAHFEPFLTRCNWKVAGCSRHHQTRPTGQRHPHHSLANFHWTTLCCGSTFKATVPMLTGAQRMPHFRLRWSTHGRFHTPSRLCCDKGTTWFLLAVFA